MSREKYENGLKVFEEFCEDYDYNYDRGCDCNYKCEVCIINTLIEDFKNFIKDKLSPSKENIEEILNNILDIL